MALARVVHPDYEVAGYGPSLDSTYADEAYDGTYEDDSYAYPDWTGTTPYEVQYGQPHGSAGAFTYEGPGYDYDTEDGYNGPFEDPGPTPA